ncbi:MAG TPA: trypsin-like peptidase domain-containing protein [Candidatus Eremiobacteraceae bacterium]|nr:trypsin-like peptidase domain-containing protein [Candidatus Eremiobacteraceae bacterium]
MAATPEHILLVAPGEALRDKLRSLLEAEGYAVSVAESAEHAATMLRGADSSEAVILAGGVPEPAIITLLTSLQSSAIPDKPRVLLLAALDSSQRALWLDQGIDDLLSIPWDDQELLARLRAQLRQKRSFAELARKVRNAEESYQMSQTAFQALAVTEKMTRDAFSLERILKIGVGTLTSLAIVIAVIFFLFSHKAEKESRRAYTLISQLEHNVQSQEQLLASSRRLRQDPANADITQQREQLQQQAQALRQKISAPDGADVAQLQNQLQEATNRLAKLEDNAQAAEAVIRSFAPSVCLLHVSVAFNDKDSGKRLRYGGINSDGSPLKDSDGNTVYTTEGRAPEVRADFFGSGFIAGEGKILTNHHVVQPWWANDDLKDALNQGLEPVIADMTAYFPGEPNGVPVGISQISPDADLAVVHGDLSELKRAVLKLDSRKEAAISGEALISFGYATGIDAILARAGDETVRDIVKVSGGDPKLILEELAKRKLIRPLVTQGHVGDVLTDKIVYDAQTTSGGSGGPLLNSNGGVIGVTFAVVKGFGGSNFGVPIRFAAPLLKH